MIKRFRVQNYKALRDVSLELTPMHVLIGPNDSGKTSILEAIAALCRSVDRQLSHAFTGSWEGQQLIWHAERDLPISLAASIELDTGTIDYQISFTFPVGRGVQLNEESAQLESESEPVRIGAKGDGFSKVFRSASRNEHSEDAIRNRARSIYDSLLGVHSYRWSPRFLALPVAPDSKRRFRMDPSGFGLARCLDDILGYDPHRFIRLEDRFRTIFPQFKSIKLLPEPAFHAPVDSAEEIPILQKSEGKGIHFELAAGDQLISASQVSDGVLLVLAYLAILHLPQSPHVMLVEEPENGIHPKRLQDVLSILRELVNEKTRTQVVMTTHSPYVVDQFKPEEVTLCQKQKDGSICVRRLSESSWPRTADMMDLF
jgi:predicted ATPase